jgi:hypothetical protein
MNDEQTRSMNSQTQDLLRIAADCNPISALLVQIIGHNEWTTLAAIAEGFSVRDAKALLRGEMSVVRTLLAIERATGCTVEVALPAGSH